MRMSLRLLSAACILTASIGCQPADNADVSTDLGVEMGDSNTTATGEMPEIESPLDEAIESVEATAFEAKEEIAEAAAEVQEAAAEVQEYAADALEAAQEKAAEIVE